MSQIVMKMDSHSDNLPPKWKPECRKATEPMLVRDGKDKPTRLCVEVSMDPVVKFNEASDILEEHLASAAKKPVFVA